MRTTIFKSLIVFIAMIAVSTTQAKNKSQKDFEQLEKKVKERLATFDDLDFNVFSNQKWDELKRSHTQNVKVHWPDGHITEGIDRHIADLKYMFTYAPDTRIKEHPIKIGQGDWTAVYGIMEGTFTKPMTTPDGKVIQPTGKSFKLPMATIAHWTKDGNFDEEYLFWDNQTYMNQLGLGK
ncbi:ester cyclase [Bdellovibrio sp. NC01]|uniref:ester cyclase n=1 Tax=Bdellovibrio sp. NC01 TaxID=2220073 RepID=UPI001157FC5B|nr:ester cyclase [Bdellovibrio sp. NC01]QDK37549.1 polyketide cyclase [Bdellovibrio sp. NC01]